MNKVMFFLKSSKPTVAEMAELAELLAQTFNVVIRDGSSASALKHGNRREVTTFVAGTVPELYSDVPVFEPPTSGNITIGSQVKVFDSETGVEVDCPLISHDDALGIHIPTENVLLADGQRKNLKVHHHYGTTVALDCQFQINAEGHLRDITLPDSATVLLENETVQIAYGEKGAVQRGVVVYDGYSRPTVKLDNAYTTLLVLGHYVPFTTSKGVAIKSEMGYCQVSAGKFNSVQLANSLALVSHGDELTMSSGEVYFFTVNESRVTGFAKVK